MAIGQLKLRVDTQGAQKSINSFSKSWTEANQATELFSKGLDFVINQFEGMMNVLKESGDFFSQYSQAGDAAAAKLEVLRQASDDMIASTELLRTANVLSNNGMNVSIKTMENMAKAAVELARQTGGSSDAMLKMLTNALGSARISSLNKFGFNLKTTGTEAEKQERIIKALSDRYSELTIKAGDVAEVSAKMKNALKTETMFKVKEYDSLAQKIERIKKGVKDITTNTLLGKLGAKSWAMQLIELDNASRKFTSNIIQGIKTVSDMQVNLNTLQNMGNLSLGARQTMVNEIAEKQKENVKTINNAIINETVLLGKLTEGTKQYKASKAKLDELNIELANQKGIMKEIARIQKDLNDDWQRAADNLRNRFNSFLDSFNANLKASQAAAKKRREAAKRAWEQEQSILNGYKKQLKAQDSLIQKLGVRATIEDKIKRQELEFLSRASKKERERFLENQKNVKTLSDRRKEDFDAQSRHVEKIGGGKKKLSDAERIALEKRNQKEREYIALVDQAVKMQEAHKDAIAAAQVKAMDMTATQKIQLDITKAKKELQTAMAMGNAGETARIKENIAALQAQKFAVNESLGAFKAMSGNIVKGLTMESAELKKLGKSRTDFIMDTLKATLKAKGIEYAIKSLGALAEGTAAVFFNPPAAAALFKAAGLYAAAAAAAGTASMAIGSSGTSAATQTSPSASASSGETTDTTTGGSKTININISRGTIFGNTDMAARQIKRALADAESRGAI